MKIATLECGHFQLAEDRVVAVWCVACNELALIVERAPEQKLSPARR
ncbi:MAG: hypothetical protein ACR2KJ_07185 [Jatrophihabitans sp.]